MSWPPMDLINWELLIRLCTCTGCARDSIGLSRERCHVCGHQLVAVLYSPLDGERLTIVQPRLKAPMTSAWQYVPPGETRAYAIA